MTFSFLDPTDTVHEFSSKAKVLVSLLLLRNTSGILPRKEWGEGNVMEEHTACRTQEGSTPKPLLSACATASQVLGGADLLNPQPTTT